VSQRWLEGILLSRAREVIAARTKVSCAENRTSRDLTFQVEVILQRVRELRMVSSLDEEQRLREHRILRPGKTRENQRIYAKKRR